ncbi:MAG: response regulator [Desulfatitalea sp.]
MSKKRPPQSSPLAQPETSSKIMIVEDDPICREFARAMLVDAGYCICAAGDGRQCLEQVPESLPDLILMDVSMPAMDGIQACRQLKADAICKHIPVIFVTSNTDDQTLEAAFNAGGSDYVLKPVRRVELLARVRTALAQRRMSLKLAEEEKLKGVLETAGGVCHELNQPLQFVLGAVQLLMLDISPDSSLYANLDTIRARIEQMGEITRKLAEITRFRTRKYMGGKDIIDIDQSISGSNGA